MKRMVWRLTCGIVGLGLVLVVVESIETYTAHRRHEEFIRRTGPIHEGMTEADVKAVAGPPDGFVTDFGSTTNDDAVGAPCRKANGIAAMLYTFEHCGWMCEHLGLMSGGSVTEVVCLDDRRIVVKTYLEMIHY
jgi:hypothetical protein